WLAAAPGCAVLDHLGLRELRRADQRAQLLAEPARGRLAAPSAARRRGAVAAGRRARPARRAAGEGAVPARRRLLAGRPGRGQRRHLQHLLRRGRFAPRQRAALAAGLRGPAVVPAGVAGRTGAGCLTRASGRAAHRPRARNTTLIRGPASRTLGMPCSWVVCMTWLIASRLPGTRSTATRSAWSRLARISIRRGAPSENTATGWPSPSRCSLSPCMATLSLPSR